MARKTISIAILVGAGKGRRIGLKDKSFLPVNKKPILAYSISPFEECNAIDKIILVVRKNKINSAEYFVNKYNFYWYSGLSIDQIRTNIDYLYFNTSIDVDSKGVKGLDPQYFMIDDDPPLYIHDIAYNVSEILIP